MANFRKDVKCTGTRCEQSTVVDFTDDILKMVLLADDDVKKEVLANDKLEKMNSRDKGTGFKVANKHTYSCKSCWC